MDINSKPVVEVPPIAEEKSALIMLHQYTGCTMENINMLSNKITYILEAILHMTHEDKSNKIEMLRKIESELCYLSEKRDYIFSRPKGHQGQANLEDVEYKVDKDRKEIRRTNA